jgi:hypothetical protein
MVLATHVITLPLPGYPHPEATVELPAMQVKRGVYMTGSNTLRYDREIIDIQKIPSEANCKRVGPSVCDPIVGCDDDDPRGCKFKREV